MGKRQGAAVQPDEGCGYAHPHIADRLRELEDENAQLRAEIDSIRTRAAMLQTLADSDTLTPLANRRRFLAEVDRALAGVRRYGTGAALIFADVDGLKAINDGFGHAAGDAALIHIAKVLLAHVRATDLVARIAGDEFGMVLDHIDDAGAAAKAERLCAAIAAAPLVHNGVELAVSMSVGTTVLQANDSVETVLARADAEMYAARRAKRERAQ